MADGSIWPSVRRPIAGQTIIAGDCLDVMSSQLRDEVFDVVVTSPPYNLNLSYSLYDDARTEQDYLRWLILVSEQVYRILKDLMDHSS